MQSSIWVALLRHIPAEQHDQYMLVTTSGTEIAIQGLLRIEEEFVAVKGRLSGSQDGGRVFFIPYQQIDHFGTQKPVKESDFTERFGTLVVPQKEREAAAEREPAGADEVHNGANRGSGPRPVIRSEVLERYRSRPSSSAILPNLRSDGS